MLVPFLVACAPHPVAPADPVAPGEAEERAACAKGERCLGLAAMLEADAPSPSRIREAIDLTARLAEDDLQAAQVAVLVANAHPDISTPGERAAAWLRLCEHHGFRAGCEVGARALASEQPDVAARLRAKGCALELSHLCAAAPRAADPVPEAFVQALAAVGGDFEMPPGFHVVPSPEDPRLPADLTLLSDDGRLEVRYALRDDTAILKEVDACGSKPGCVAADAEKIEMSMGVVALANFLQVPPDQLTIGKFPPLPVRVEFNASWGLAGGGVRDGEVISYGYLHRAPGANLYIFTVFHDPAASDDLQPVAFHALRFAEPIGLANPWL